VLRNIQVIRAGESLTVRNVARFTPGSTEQHAVRAKRSSRKRQTKPIEISYKRLAFKELTLYVFGIIYAKQTQFQVVEAAIWQGWGCRKPARREARPALDRGPDWPGIGPADPNLDNACPASAIGRGANGGGRMADGGGHHVPLALCGTPETSTFLYRTPVHCR